MTSPRTSVYRTRGGVRGTDVGAKAETLYTNEYLELANSVDFAAVRALSGKIHPTGRR